MRGVTESFERIASVKRFLSEDEEDQCNGSV